MQQPSISLTLSLCHRFSKQPFISLALSFSLTPSLSADPSSLIHPLSQSRTEIPLHLKTPKSPTLTLVSLEAKESTPSSPQDFNPRSYQIEVYKAALMRNTIAVLETGAGKTMIAVMLMKEIGRLMKENGIRGLLIFLAPQVSLVNQHIPRINSYIPNLSDAGQDHQQLLQRDNERNSWAPRQSALGWHVSFLKSLA